MAPIKTNNPYASYFDFFSRTGKDAVTPEPPPLSGLTATGGVISDYEDSGTYYRAHVFTSSGALNVTATGDFGTTVEYLVVAGGGGGGDDDAGGGGAGGFRTNLTGHPLKAADYTVAVGGYTVTVGGGGAGSSEAQGDKGSNSEFYPTPVSYPSTARVRSVGGGGGYKSSDSPTQDGGSGGGSGWNAPDSTYGSGNTPTDPNHPQVQGYRGGANHSSISAGGGGGAGGVGQPGSVSAGGIGVQCLIAGSPANPQPVGAPGPGSGAAATGWFAGGGGGGGRVDVARYGGGGSSAPYSGGGTGGGPTKTVTPGTVSSGGGGGGYGPDAGGVGGSGGSGVVVVRYQIGSQQTGTAKATGGAISYYGSKTIHAFTNSGTFATTASWSAANIEYVIIGGGAGGGGSQGGGGGAGAYKTGTTPIGSHPVSTTIQIGAGGNGGAGSPTNTPGVAGTPSYFGTPITSPGGGYGGFGAAGNPGGPGGSGGGTGYDGNIGPGTGDNFPGNLADSVPANGWGHDGGLGVTPSNYGSGGGGGAGGVGQQGTPSKGATGGVGIQIPSTFRNPQSATALGGEGPTSAPTPNGFDTSGKFWFAGGGGGSIYGPNPSPDGGTGGGGPGTTPFAGAGNAGGNATGAPSPTNAGADALENTGAGGGGGYVTSSPASTNGHRGGSGGSGLVLIAYPT